MAPSDRFGERFADLWSVSLTESLLGPQNRVKWAKLGTTLFGGVLLAIWSGIIQVQLMAKRAIALLFGGLPAFVQQQIGRYLGGISRETSRAWASTGIDLGFLQLPFNTVVALLGLGVLVWGVRNSL